MHMVKKATKEHAGSTKHAGVSVLANCFHRLEDLHTFVDSIALMAFFMEVVEGFPSGFANTRCPHSATSLYTVYIMFNTVFVLLCVLTCISILTWIFDFSVQSTSDITHEMANKTRWWNTRHDELTATEIIQPKYAKVAPDSQEDEDEGHEPGAQGVSADL